MGPPLLREGEMVLVRRRERDWREEVEKVKRKETGIGVGK